MAIPTLTSTYAYVVNRDTNEVYYTKAHTTAAKNASITKMMVRIKKRPDSECLTRYQPILGPKTSGQALHQPHRWRRQPRAQAVREDHARENPAQVHVEEAPGSLEEEGDQGL